MEVKQQMIINQPIEKVWDVLGNQFGQAHLWASGLYHSKGFGLPKLEGAACSNRACETSIGNIKEEIISFDPHEHILSYEVIEGFPSFIESGVNTWALTDLGAGKTKLDMHLRMKTRGLMGKLMGPMMQLKMKKLTAEVVDDFRVYVESGQPSERKQKENRKMRVQAA